MEEKKDRRSRRDKLKDGMLEKMERNIELLEAQVSNREQDNENDVRMIKIINQQINDIHAMCTKQDETDKASGKKAT